MNDNSEGGGFYLLIGALAVAVAVLFVVLSGHRWSSGGDRGADRVGTPHAQLDLPQPPVLRVKYQSKICSPVQNKTPSCLPA
jgi:hypothetical protein